MRWARLVLPGPGRAGEQQAALADVEGCDHLFEHVAVEAQALRLGRSLERLKRQARPGRFRWEAPGCSPEARFTPQSTSIGRAAEVTPADVAMVNEVPESRRGVLRLVVPSADGRHWPSPVRTAPSAGRGLPALDRGHAPGHGLGRGHHRMGGGDRGGGRRLGSGADWHRTPGSCAPPGASRPPVRNLGHR